jgi:hypothetical protein
MGSRQASSTIWARCRGGNLLGAAQAEAVQQQGPQPALLIAATDTPDGGTVTLQPGRDRLDGFSRGNGEHDAGALDLEEGQVAAVRHAPQNRGISGGDCQGTRLSATHGVSSSA